MDSTEPGEDWTPWAGDRGNGGGEGGARVCGGTEADVEGEGRAVDGVGYSGGIGLETDCVLTRGISGPVFKVLPMVNMRISTGNIISAWSFCTSCMSFRSSIEVVQHVMTVICEHVNDNQIPLDRLQPVTRCCPALALKQPPPLAGLVGTDL